jgi:hypothetical protein
MAHKAHKARKVLLDRPVLKGLALRFKFKPT